MIEGPFPPTLDRALDEEYMIRALRSTVQKTFNENTIIDTLQVKHLQRRLVRYTMRLTDSERKQNYERKIIGKVYEKLEDMNYGFGVMQQLCQHGFAAGASDRISIPAPIACLPEIRLLLMQEIPGGPLRRLVKRTDATENNIRHFARATVKLHRSQIILGSPFTVEDHIAQCRPSPQVLAQTYPDSADAINLIVEEARSLQKHLGGNIYTLIHGDFHPGQVHVDGNNLWILDLEPLRYGDPAHDLAKVLAFFKRTARKSRMRKYIELMRDVFIEEYFSFMDFEIAKRIPLYEALICLKRACKCLRVQDETGWEEKMTRLIEQGSACIRVMADTPGDLDVRGVIKICNRSPGST